MPCLSACLTALLPATCAQSFVLSPPPVTVGPHLSDAKPVRVYRYTAPPALARGRLFLDAAEPGSTGASVVTILVSRNTDAGSSLSYRYGIHLVAALQAGALHTAVVDSKGFQRRGVPPCPDSPSPLSASPSFSVPQLLFCRQRALQHLPYAAGHKLHLLHRCRARHGGRHRRRGAHASDSLF